LLMNFIDDSFNFKSMIYQVSLGATPSVQLFADTGGNMPEGWRVDRIEIDGNTLLAVHSSATTGFYAIDTTTAEYEILSVGNDGVKKAFAGDLDAEVIYIIKDGGVSALETGTSSSSRISHPDSVEQLSLSVHDESIQLSSDNQLYIGDKNNNQIIVVDISSGEHSILSVQTLGSGPSIVSGKDIKLAENSEYAYVLDDANDGPEKLVRIHLSSVVRETIGDISDGTNPTAAALELDEENGIAYVALENSVKKIDLESHVVTDIANLTADTGSISDMLLDKVNNRLLLSDSELNSIFALDLTTYAKTIVSKESVAGDGVPFSVPVRMSFGASPDVIYVGNNNPTGILLVNLSTGNRTLAYNSCEVGTLNYFPQVGQLRALHYNAELNSLFVGDYAVIEYDLNTGSCGRTNRPSMNALTFFPDQSSLSVSNSGGVMLTDGKALDSISISD